MNYRKPNILKVQLAPNSDKPYKSKGADSWNPFKKEVTHLKADHTNKSREDHVERILGYEFEGKTIGGKKK